ncbi:uncharacterized protein LOC141720181 [Apium graveolens]|uniref:uncharacterized protein LOC141720181 n=1 Tax=Apium graveolens TaxID=4045 RepID=UPI003D798C47
METIKGKDGSVGLNYPMLTKTNYTAWSLKMKVYMEAHGIWEAVEPKNEKEKVDEKMDKMALSAIYHGIPEEILLSIADKKTSKEGWQAVKTICQGADRVKKARIQTLKTEFEFLNMKDTELIDDFCVKLNGIVTNIRALRESIDEAYVVKKLLRAVPEKFLQITSTIEQFSNLETMTIEEAVGSLKAHEERLRGKNESNGSQLLLTEEEWRDERSEVTEVRLSALTAIYTDIVRRSVVSLIRGKDKDQKTEVNLTRIHDDDEPALLMVEHMKETKKELMLNEQTVRPRLSATVEKLGESNMWYLDNGAYNHMTGYRSKFKSLDEGVMGQVRFGDGSTVEIQEGGQLDSNAKMERSSSFTTSIIYQACVTTSYHLVSCQRTGKRLFLKVRFYGYMMNVID